MIRWAATILFTLMLLAGIYITILIGVAWENNLRNDPREYGVENLP